MLNAAGDKSFVDDLAASGYCKCESSLCCYEALRFIPCFYDLFFSVLQDSAVLLATAENSAKSDLMRKLVRILGIGLEGYSEMPLLCC